MSRPSAIDRRQVRVVLTEPAQHFWERSQAYAPEAWQAFQALPEPIPLLRDADEWAAWDELGDRVVHIELREWADVLVVAPLSANTLAKLAHGMCDNLLVRSKERGEVACFSLGEKECKKADCDHDADSWCTH